MFHYPCAGKINAEREHWDVVVIIRGGGATSDLSGFDTYELATNCAQFPLPIITGIGHERDDTVLDMIAHTRVKTPTAAAEFLIDHMRQTAERLEEYTQFFIKNFRPCFFAGRNSLNNGFHVFRYGCRCVCNMNVSVRSD